MVLMPGFQSTRLVTEGALEPFFFLYTDDSIQGNPETCKQSSIMLNYEVKNNPTVPEKMLMVIAMIFGAHLLPYSWLYKSKTYMIMSVLIPIASLIVGCNSTRLILALMMLVFEIIFTALLIIENRKI